MPLTSSTCVQCGATDDHPKYIGDEIWHHDCLPAALRASFADTPHGSAIIDAANSGTRGDALRVAISDLHKEN